MIGLNRRCFAGSVVAVAGASVLPGTPFAQAGRKRLSGRIGIQLFMLEADLTKDFSGTLGTVRAIGYREVETAIDHGSPAQMRAEFDRAGLVCPSIHIPIEALQPGMLSLADPAAAISAAKTIGAANIVVPIYPFLDELRRRYDYTGSDMAKFAKGISEIGRSKTSADWLVQAEQLNRIGSILSKSGIHLSNHNHYTELDELPNGKMALDLLMEATDPKLVSFELDIGWVKFAGRDPVAIMKRYRDRITQLHLKDLAPGNQPTDVAMKPADVGEGVMDWSAVLACLPKSAVQHVYVEQEPPYTEADPPLLAARKAYDFLHSRMQAAGA